MKYAYKNKDGLYFKEHYLKSGKRDWQFTDDLNQAYTERMNTAQYGRHIKNKFDGHEFEEVEL
ncbi:hypothetical protein IV73_GL000146 [Weissella kandleri]|uniref:Uncharacterized protein n=1 Tax=Weissella kandleri TaxID=1616 RepID=A0A0R2JIF5_9LACO|nr:hypothetical protein [Weissella kandleri]KRN75654.1 hypothetical protein IV73_GL000146 [Weissella kandleri]